MGVVVDFQAARSGDLSDSSRKRSAVKPASRARAVRKIGRHHSEGIESRCSHLRAAAVPAPISAAIASADDQSLTTSRKDETIPELIGRAVLHCKEKMSHDPTPAVMDNTSMPERMTESEEKDAFIRRTRLAREARFAKQKPMQIILGVDQGTYKQYETRTALPRRYIPKFCAATGVSIEWLLTGEGKGPETENIPRRIEKRIRSRAKGRAA